MDAVTKFFIVIVGATLFVVVALFESYGPTHNKSRRTLLINCAVYTWGILGSCALPIVLATLSLVVVYGDMSNLVVEFSALSHLRRSTLSAFTIAWLSFPVACFTAIRKIRTLEESTGMGPEEITRATAFALLPLINIVVCVATLIIGQFV